MIKKVLLAACVSVYYCIIITQLDFKRNKQNCNCSVLYPIYGPSRKQFKTL